MTAHQSNLLIVWVWNGVHAGAACLLNIIHPTAWINPADFQGWATLGVTCLTGVSIVWSMYWIRRKNHVPKRKFSKKARK